MGSRGKEKGSNYATLLSPNHTLILPLFPGETLPTGDNYPSQDSHVSVIQGEKGQTATLEWRLYSNSNRSSTSWMYSPFPLE